LLREKYPAFNFIGVEPYINIINKEGNTAHQTAVLVTPSTATSIRFIKLKKRLDPKDLVDVVPLKDLATLAEEIFFRGENPDLISKVEKELSSIKNKYSQVILGCTHYLRIEGLISKILGTKCISPAGAIANRVKEIVKPNSQDWAKSYYFLTTSQKNWKLKKFPD
jgi:glutamate racemase